MVFKVLSCKSKQKRRNKQNFCLFFLVVSKQNGNFAANYT